jgi:hypothetical protein
MEGGGMNLLGTAISDQNVNRTIDSVQSIWIALQRGLDHAAQVAALALAGVRLVPLAAALYIALRLFGGRFRSSLFPARRTLLRIAPPAHATYESQAWIGLFRSLTAITPPAWKRFMAGVPWVTLELQYSEGQLTARCSCPTDATHLMTAAIAAALPGADVVPEMGGDPAVLPPSPAGRARLGLWRDPLHSLGTPRLDPLVSAMAAMTAVPEAIIQLSIAPDPGWERQAQRAFDSLSGFPRHNLLVEVVRFFVGILLGAVSELVGIFLPPFSPSPETRAPAPLPQPPSVKGSLPPSDKAWAPALLAEVRLCAWAQSAGQAKQAARAMAGAFHVLDGANRVRARRVLLAAAFDRELASRAAPRHTTMHLSAEELSGFFHLPVGGARMESAQVRLAPPVLPRRDGAVLCRADGRTTELIRIGQPDRRQHMSITGPTGAGKTALLMRLALQDVDARVGAGAVDPKGDLIRDLCERIPEEAFGRVVLIDPSHREMPIGLNVLECPDPAQREVVCDDLVTIFRKTFQQFWGPRTEDVLRASLLTVMRHPELTICEVPILLLNDDFRAALTRDLDDRFLRMFWEEYEQLTVGQRLQVVGPLLNKLRAFLLRPTVRNILGQSKSTIDLGAVMDGSGVLLVSLAKGLLGEDTSRLLGAFIVARIWQTAQSRIAVAPDQRRDFNLYLDEFQDYLHLPQSLEDVLAQARTYRLNLTLANQHLAQLKDSTREALGANARTRVVFQCGQDDARLFAREFEPLTDHQLQNLGRFQVAVRLCVDGHTEPAFTGHTEPPAPGLGELNAERLVRRSLERYGRPRKDVEVEMEARLRRFGVRGGFKEVAS